MQKPFNKKNRPKIQDDWKYGPRYSHASIYLNRHGNSAVNSGLIKALSLSELHTCSIYPGDTPQDWYVRFSAPDGFDLHAYGTTLQFGASTSVNAVFEALGITQKTATFIVDTENPIQGSDEEEPYNLFPLFTLKPKLGKK